MPLEKSKSNSAVGHNIKKELAAGKTLKEAQAIALSEQREAKSKDHGEAVKKGLKHEDKSKIKK